MTGTSQDRSKSLIGPLYICHIYFQWIWSEDIVINPPPPPLSYLI